METTTKHIYTGLEWSGIDRRDHPDYCDAYISSGEIDGREMTDEELEELNENDELRYELLMEHLY